MTFDKREGWRANIKEGDTVHYAKGSWSKVTGTTGRISVSKVESITPTGCIKVAGTTFNPDGKERGVSHRNQRTLVDVDTTTFDVDVWNAAHDALEKADHDLDKVERLEREQRGLKDPTKVWETIIGPVINACKSLPWAHKVNEQEVYGGRALSVTVGDWNRTSLKVELSAAPTWGHQVSDHIDEHILKVSVECGNFRGSTSQVRNHAALVAKLAELGDAAIFNLGSTKCGKVNSRGERLLATKDACQNAVDAARAALNTLANSKKAA